MSASLHIPPGGTYPPTPNGGLPTADFLRRGPYLEASATGDVIELRVPSPYPVSAGTGLWKRNGMRWDGARQEWHRVTTRPLDSLRVATLRYEEFYPEFATARPIATPPDSIGRADFLNGHPARIIVHEWPRGWQVGDIMVAYSEHDRADFDLAGALDWCRRHGAYVVQSARGDTYRCFFDGLRAIRTEGQIRRARSLHSTAQVDFAYQ